MVEQAQPEARLLTHVEMVNRLEQDTDPIFFGSKSAASQLQVTQNDINNIVQMTH